MWELLGEALTTAAFAYLLVSVLRHRGARGTALAGFSLQTVLGLVLLHFLRLPLPTRISRWNEAGDSLDIVTFCLLCAAIVAGRPLPVSDHPFGCELLLRTWPRLRGARLQVASFAVLMALCLVVGAIFSVAGRQAIAEDDHAMRFGPVRSFLSQVHLSLEGLVLLPQCAEMHRAALDDEPVPPRLAHFLAILSAARLSFAVSGVGFFGWLVVHSALDGQIRVNALELYYCVTQLANLAIFADFAWYWLRSRALRIPLVLPKST